MSSPVIQMRTPAEQAFIERFAAEKATLPGAAEARAAAMARFVEKGLPTKRVEAYHYTDIRQAMRELAPAAVMPGSASTVLTAAGTISFRNGYLVASQALPKGVSALPLAEALATGAGAPGSAMGAASDVVVDLNTAFTRDGALIRVSAGATIESVLRLDFEDAFSGMGGYVSPRVIVEIGEGAAMTLVESISGSPAIAYQVNSMLELRLAKGAKVEHIRLNQAGDKALILSNLAATLAEGAELCTLNVTLGGETSRHQVFVSYQGENAKADIRGAALLKGSQHHDSTLVVDHAVPHGVSRELFRTVVDGQAQGVFQGKIIVRPHAQKTDGQMASNALLLSDDAGMSNKPELEIFADDVVCAHGATCGALDENQLFYLQARGIPRAEAEALLVEAFIGEVFETVSDEELREKLAGLVSDWMKARAGG